MRKIFIITVFLGLFSCQYHNTSTVDKLRTDFSAAKGNTVTTGVPSFQVVVLNINDSRCPQDVQCISIGLATVTFQVGSDEFHLNIGDSKSFSVDQKNYKLTLKDVVPYPTTGNKSDDRNAIFTVEKL